MAYVNIFKVSTIYSGEMVTNVQSYSPVKSGLCPHGLSPSGCPICSGMGGGMRKDKPQATKPMTNEWSYARCVAAGMAIKNREARIEETKTALEKQLLFAERTSKSIENVTNKLQTFIENIKSPILQNTAQIIANVIIRPTLNLINQIPKMMVSIAEFQQKMSELIKQAGEKLTAILGEVKNFVERKITQGLKKIAKKIFLLFYSNIDNENQDDEENFAILRTRETGNFVINFLMKDLIKSAAGTLKRDVGRKEDKRGKQRKKKSKRN